MKYKKTPVDSYKRLGQFPVYIEDVYWGKEPFKIVGIREDEIELQGDWSGGTHNVSQKGWVKDKRCFIISSVCEEQLSELGCQQHNLHCCGGGKVINEHTHYWENLI